MKRIEDFITDYDIHLFLEGNNFEIYKKLGAHILDVGGINGTLFSVWAPNAKHISVIGDFNEWNGDKTPMENIRNSGVWAVFVPGVGKGTQYKFSIRSRFGADVRVKSDPFAFYSEVRPKSASVVYDIDSYKWGDSEWLNNRSSLNLFESPVSIYEVHLGSWMRVPEEKGRFLTYSELSEILLPYVRELGFTHIELLPVTEHPFDASWGYQTTGYYSPTSRFGRPEELMAFIDEAHRLGIGVILDWVPGHFPKDDHGLRFFDGSCLYEHADERQGEHKGWGTLVFNFGRNEVRNFLISNALFWIDKYHIDGLRVDAVASMLYLDYDRKEGEWVPNIYGGKENIDAIGFLKRFNEVVHGYHPGVLTIAEESTDWPGVSHPTYLGGLGFSMKWNMGWMHDMLDYFEKDPIHRKYHANAITFSLLYAFSENFILPLSHDEVVHGKRSLLSKMPGDDWQKFANLRAFYGFMYGHPGKKLLFMGGEFGQWDEWDSEWSLDWHLVDSEYNAKLTMYLKDLNRLYRSQPALFELDHTHEGFDWIDFKDHDSSVISFMRKNKAGDNLLLFVCNFTPVIRSGYRVGVPLPGSYKEVLNSDSYHYGGSNMGNYGTVDSNGIAFHGMPYSILIDLPPLSTLIFIKDVDNKILEH
ncbi:MAG: 1,4-alpha-glucan branching protein GlgB [Nitrospirota bacterium]|nr:MAG: 1,4-alpha-glucan branching protein GlgB [Nitrospirota bacterium]